MPFCGHPLLAWTVCCARAARGIDSIYVSTDSTEIAAVAREYGAAVIDRPPEISGDDASSESALLHALDVIERTAGTLPDAVLFLQATSPLREVSELDGALAEFDQGRLDSLFSAAHHNRLIWREEQGQLRSLTYDFNHRNRRQDAESDALETGSFYITRTRILWETGNRLGGRIGLWPVPFWKSCEIDSWEDFELCERLMRAYGLDQSHPVRRDATSPESRVA